MDRRISGSYPPFPLATPADRVSFQLGPGTELAKLKASGLFTADCGLSWSDWQRSTRQRADVGRRSAVAELSDVRRHAPELPFDKMFLLCSLLARVIVLGVLLDGLRRFSGNSLSPSRAVWETRAAFVAMRMARRSGRSGC